MAQVRLAAAVACIAWTAAVTADAPPSLRTVVERLHAYLSEYAIRLPATIAAEHYEQQCEDTARVRIAGSGRAVLDSEFGIMRMENPAGWLGVRDVQRLNGEPIPDRQDRLQALQALFRNSSAGGLDQALRIALENARYNVGPIRRTINDPAVVLAMLEDDPDRTPMRFAKAGETAIDGVAAWIVKFEERRRPTLIQRTSGGDQPAKGTAWVDPVTGRLMRAELSIDAPPDF